MKMYSWSFDNIDLFLFLATFFSDLPNIDFAACQ